jgi:hypothetical protein
MAQNIATSLFQITSGKFNPTTLDFTLAMGCLMYCVYGVEIDTSAAFVGVPAAVGLLLLGGYVAFQFNSLPSSPTSPPSKSPLDRIAEEEDESPSDEKRLEDDGKLSSLDATTKPPVTIVVDESLPPTPTSTNDHLTLPLPLSPLEPSLLWAASIPIPPSPMIKDSKALEDDDDEIIPGVQAAVVEVVEVSSDPMMDSLSQSGIIVEHDLDSQGIKGSELDSLHSSGSNSSQSPSAALLATPVSKRRVNTRFFTFAQASPLRTASEPANASDPMESSTVHVLGRPGGLSLPEARTRKQSRLSKVFIGPLASVASDGNRRQSMDSGETKSVPESGTMPRTRKHSRLTKVFIRPPPGVASDGSQSMDGETKSVGTSVDTGLERRNSRIGTAIRSVARRASLLGGRIRTSLQ